MLYYSFIYMKLIGFNTVFIKCGLDSMTNFLIQLILKDIIDCKHFQRFIITCIRYFDIESKFSLNNSLGYVCNVILVLFQKDRKFGLGICFNIGDFLLYIRQMFIFTVFNLFSVITENIVIFYIVSQ